MNYRSIIFLFICSATVGAVRRYDGYSVWRLDADLEVSMSITEIYGLEIWRQHDPLEVLVSPHQQSQLLQACNNHEIQFHVLMEDVQKQIEATLPLLLKDDSEDFDLADYHTLDEIRSYLTYLEESSDMVSLVSIGKSFEGETLTAVRLSTDARASKMTVWVDCGIHAEEWIGPAACLWGLHHLITQHGNDSLVDQVLDQYDIMILPVYNVDGYKYTWTEDRMWRKNRAYYGIEDCYGVDMNRNYDDGHWGGIGSSNHSCNRIYHGPGPFSESETRAVRDAITNIQTSSGVVATFSIHSFSQRWLFPFGYTYMHPTEFEEIDKVAETGAAVMESIHGVHYAHGQHFTTIYPATGTVIDWAYSIGIPYTYIVELRDKGEFGFLLPQDQIIPTGQETWAGLLSAVLTIQ